MTDRRWDTERQEWVYPADWRPIADAPREGSADAHNAKIDEALRECSHEGS